MGLFDAIGQDRNSGDFAFLREAKEFGTLDLNAIFKEATAATISWFTHAIEFFTQLFKGTTCTIADGAMVERMIDQVPGMVLVAVKLGWLDPSFLDEYKKHPDRAEWISNARKYPFCTQAEDVARVFWTVLFGVRIGNDHYLNNLDVGVDAYYATDGYDNTNDIPREAVVRAVYLKQTFFPASTYNVKQWDMNQFQRHPLVKPIPDPFHNGKLFTGNIFGVQVVNGLLQGTALVPVLPTNTNFNIIDPYHAIIYANQNGSGTTATIQPTAPGNLIDRAMAFIKSNPRTAVAAAAAAGFLIYELNEKD